MRIASLVAVVGALAAPALAHADPTTIAARELPLGKARVAAAAQPAGRFDLLGLHWQGPGTVDVRTHALSGAWSKWQTADTDGNGRDRWRFGNPIWAGPSDRIDYRTSGRVLRLRAYYVWSPVEAVPLRTLSIAGSPQIIPRLGWAANEQIRGAPPRYAPALHFAVVHHTAGTNSYGPADSAAIVRGIEVYHVKGNGWNDIGYNFLVDRYGQVFEGRYGGMTRNVIGAHAGGFNTGSAGVSVIGDFSHSVPPPAALASLEKLLAWRLDLAHVDPLSSLTWISGGNSRFPTGSPVFLRAIAGHRDTGFTDCPGNALYALLPQIAHDVAAIGLPKLFEPQASGKLGGMVRIIGRLSSALPWTVIVVGPAGQAVTHSSGTGTQISFTWNSAGAPAGRYVWTIDAGADVRPASGQLSGGGGTVPPPPPPPPAILTGLLLAPPTISPNGDGYDETTTISYVLTAPATVTVSVADATGAVTALLVDHQREGARKQTLAFPGASALADGTYTVTVDAVGDGGHDVKLSAPLLVDRTLASVAVSPAAIQPGQTLTISFTLAKPALVTITISQADRQVATISQATMQAGPQTATWNGLLAENPVPPGAYTVIVTAKDDLGQISQPAAFQVNPP